MPKHITGLLLRSVRDGIQRAHRDATRALDGLQGILAQVSSESLQEVVCEARAEDRATRQRRHEWARLTSQVRAELARRKE